MKRIDIKGQRFGKLTAVKYVGHSKWLCVCDCGNETIAFSSNLRKGHTTSCGCNRFLAESHIGQRFDSLVVLDVKFFRTDDNGKGYTKCRCICDCGRQKTLRLDALLAGNIHSCGQCRTEEFKHKRADALRKAEFVNGTQVSRVKFDKTPTKANKSGVVGVNWDKSRNKWQASIRFKKHKYNLGRFENIADAIEARKEAEKQIFGEFIEWYESRKAKGEL